MLNVIAHFAITCSTCEQDQRFSSRALLDLDRRFSHFVV